MATHAAARPANSRVTAAPFTFIRTSWRTSGRRHDGFVIERCACWISESKNGGRGRLSTLRAADGAINRAVRETRAVRWRLK